MEQPPTAERIAFLLVTRLREMRVPVERMHVFPAIDRLNLQWILDDGSFHVATFNNPAWYSELAKDETAFISALASGLPKRLPDEVWDDKGQLDLQYLFVRLILDLDRCSRSVDDYDNLRVPSLLRTLLFDGAPLIHKVQRIHRAPLSFRVGRVLINDDVDPSTLPKATGPRLVKVRDGRTFDAVGDAFDPNNHRGEARTLLLDDLPKTLVLKVEDHWVSVRELLDHLAYVEGLVHHGQPQDTKRPADSDLQRWRRMYHSSGRGPIHATAAAIGRVVVSGLTALAFECDRAVAAGRPLFPER